VKPERHPTKAREFGHRGEFVAMGVDLGPQCVHIAVRCARELKLCAGFERDARPVAQERERGTAGLLGVGLPPEAIDERTKECLDAGTPRCVVIVERCVRVEETELLGLDADEMCTRAKRSLKDFEEFIFVCERGLVVGRRHHASIASRHVVA
jgi:hypothetical protein